MWPSPGGGDLEYASRFAEILRLGIPRTVDEGRCSDVVVLESDRSFWSLFSLASADRRMGKGFV